MLGIILNCLALSSSEVELVAFSDQHIGKRSYCGKVIKVSALPNPKTARYKDCLLYIKMSIAETGGASGASSQDETAAIVAWGFKDREFCPAASLQVDDEIQAEMIPYLEVEKTYESLMFVDDVDSIEMTLYWMDSYTKTKDSVALPKERSILPDKNEKTIKAIDAVRVKSESDADALKRARDYELDLIRRQIELNIRRTDISAQTLMLLEELYKNGGWAYWDQSLEPFRKSLLALEPNLKLDANPINDVYCSKDNWLFSGNEKAYLLSETLADHKNFNNYMQAFNSIKYLSEQLSSRGIDLLVVPTPVNLEFIAYKFGFKESCSPALLRKKFMLHLLQNDVEVLDIEPFFRKAISQGSIVYRPDDSHWAPKAPEILAEQIHLYCKRRYSFPEKSIQRTNYVKKEEEVFFRRHGIYAKLNRPEVQDLSLKVSLVKNEKGDPYKDSDISPILVFGDSWTEIYRQQSANISAQLAYKLGFPVTYIWNNGGGARLPERLFHRPRLLENKKLVIWIFCSKFLWRDAVELDKAPRWKEINIFSKDGVKAQIEKKKRN